jgi:hypothetical protein
VHRDPGLIVLIAEMVLALMPPINQTLQEVVELKDFVRSSRDIRPLGKGGRVGSVGCDAHAIGIQRIERWLMRDAYWSAGIGQI